MVPVCSNSVFFYHNTLGPKTYSAPGGAIADCGGKGSSQSGGSKTGTGNTYLVEIGSTGSGTGCP